MGLKRWCVYLFVGACLLRLLFLGLLLLSPDRYIGSSDSVWYDEVAWNLAEGRGFTFGGNPTAFHPPGYPLLLSAIYTVFGHSQGAAQAVGIVLSSFVPVLTVLLVVQLGLGDRIARLAGVLMALYPSQIFYSTFIGSEALCAVLVVAAALAAVHRRYIPSALLLGLAGLTRAIALVYIPLLVLLMLWENRSQPWVRRAAVGAAVVLVGFGPLIPWALRNDHQVGSPVFTSTSDGYSLWAGNSDGSTGYYRPIPPEVDAELPEGEVARDTELRNRGLRWMVENPVSVVALVPRKLAHLFIPDASGLAFNKFENESKAMDVLYAPLAAAAQVFHWGILALAAFAAPGLWRSHRRVAVAMAVSLALFVAGVVATHAENRYRVPFAFLLVIPAAFALDGLRRAERVVRLVSALTTTSPGPHPQPSPTSRTASLGQGAE